MNKKDSVDDGQEGRGMDEDYLSIEKMIKFLDELPIETGEQFFLLKAIKQKLHEAALPVADGEYIEGLKKLLRMADCPEILIENPYLLKGKKPTDADYTWAEGVIKRYEEHNKAINQNLPAAMGGVKEFIWTDKLVDEYSIQRLDGNFLTMQEFKQSKSEGQQE